MESVQPTGHGCDPMASGGHCDIRRPIPSDPYHAHVEAAYTRYQDMARKPVRWALWPHWCWCNFRFNSGKGGDGNTLNDSTGEASWAGCGPLRAHYFDLADYLLSRDLVDSRPWLVDCRLYARKAHQYAHNNYVLYSGYRGALVDEQTSEDIVYLKINEQEARQ